MDVPVIEHQDSSATLTVSEDHLDLLLATHTIVSESSEGCYIYFGKMIPDTQLQPSEEQRANLQLVAKIFLPKTTADNLTEILNTRLKAKAL